MKAASTAASLPTNSLEVVLALALVFVAAMTTAIIAAGFARRLLLAIEGERFHTQPLAKATVRIVRRIVFALVGLVLIFPALDFAGVNMNVGLHDEDLERWVSHTGIRVLALLTLAFAANRFAASAIGRAEYEIAESAGPGGFERRKRAQTLGTTIRRFISILTWTVATLVILRELDVDITPVLTGAGILGLAVGFGAQTLVKDIISGIFIIVEDQVRVGDVAVVNAVSGTCEEINLRTIVLRDAEGTVHTIPNGEIRTLANKSKDFAYYIINLAMDFEDDTDAAIEAVKAASAELMQDATFAAMILQPAEVMGVDDFKGSQAVLQFRIKTLPLKQWEVGREWRRRIKKHLTARGITLPVQKYDINVTNVKSL
jgi:small conductance mechanosensitive channel